MIEEDVKKLNALLKKSGINFEDKRVLITGGAGFLGSWISHVLVEQDALVTSIDNLSSGRESNIAELMKKDNFTFIRHDISKPIYLDDPFDFVMHLASRASPFEFEKFPIQILKANTLGIWVALGIAKRCRARFLYTSTSEIYGDPDPKFIPIPETYNGNVNPVGPRSCYDESKRAGEAFVKAYEMQHNMDNRIVRIFNSILEDQPVVVFNDEEAHLQSIGDYVKTADFKNPILVPSFDPDTCKMVLREVSHVIKHPYNGDAYEIETTYGRKVKVTGDHSVFMPDANLKPTPVPVRSLKVGDKIAIPARLPVIEKDVKKFILSETLTEICSEDELWDFAVYHPDFGEVVREKRSDIHKYNNSHFKSWKKRSILVSLHRYIENSTFPLAVVKKLGLHVPATAKIKTSRGGRQVLIPNIIEVNDMLLWLLGFFMANGGYAKNRDKGYFVSFSSNGHELKKAERLLKKVFNVNVVHPDGKKRRTIYAYSKLLVFLFERVFKVLDNRVPAWIFQLPLSKLKYFLEGYRRGIGAHSRKSYDGKLDLFSRNEGLALDISYLLLRFGVLAEIRRCKTPHRKKKGVRTHPSYRIRIKNLSNYNFLDWDKGVSQDLKDERTGELLWDTVTRIRKIGASEFVYDFSVPGTENFIAGWGVSCHNTYGPKMRAGDVYGRVVPRFIEQALHGKPLTVFGDGTQTRSFTYVRDQVEGILRLAWIDKARGEVVNIGNNVETKIIDLAKIIIELTNSDSEITFHPLPKDDPKRRCPDISKAMRLLGWKPRVTLIEGLKKTIAWFEAKI